MLSLSLLLAGCATSTSTPTTNTPEPDLAEIDEIAAEGSVDPADQALPEPLEPPEYPVAPFTSDTLYSLLAAEVAGFRMRYDVALEQYLDVARETRDPGVAARATRLALYLKDEQSALETALIWAEEAPQEEEAHRAAVDLLLRQDRLAEAVIHMEAIKDLGGLARFDLFAFRSANLTPEQRAGVLQAVSEMLARHPGDEQLMFAKAVLLEQSQAYEASLVLTDALLEITDNVNAVILKASLLSSLGEDDAAVSFLEAQVSGSADNRRLRIILARMLFEQGDLEAAQTQYGEVLAESPNDGDVLFALALIALDQGLDEEARRYFERMVRWNRRPGEAHYYLGGISERAGENEAALASYMQAGTGYEFIPAQARIASILTDDGRVAEARDHLMRMRQQYPQHRQQLTFLEAQLLTERGMADEVLAFLETVISEDPDNIDMLYFRAMTGQQFDRLDVLEGDLRRVLEIDPDNADALNALGYTLTDQTDRHEEAFELIERALAIKPDEPAFIDSMGWVQYRLKNYDEALKHLRRALSLFQNDEVAAHLGEVLWVIGEREEAMQVWQDALDLTPESEILKRVINRFAEGEDPGV